MIRNSRTVTERRGVVCKVQVEDELRGRPTSCGRRRLSDFGITLVRLISYFTKISVGGV